MIQGFQPLMTTIRQYTRLGTKPKANAVYPMACIFTSAYKGLHICGKYRSNGSRVMIDTCDATRLGVLWTPDGCQIEVN